MSANAASQGQVYLTCDGAIASVTFDRPEARNAMTSSMYAQLQDICERVREDAAIRVVRFQGAGTDAFVAGTDIAQFLSFSGGDDGVAYEQRIDATIELLESMPMPCVAVVQGWCVGGGLAIATACDFRVATLDSKFGVPIARTLGNCLSAANVARLVGAFGRPRVHRLLLLAELISADEALASGYLSAAVSAQDIDEEADRICSRLASLAPVTQRVSKETLARLARRDLPDVQDLIRRCYASEDFREGVQAFVGKRPPQWQGR